MSLQTTGADGHVGEFFLEFTAGPAAGAAVLSTGPSAAASAAAARDTGGLGPAVTGSVLTGVLAVGLALTGVLVGLALAGVGLVVARARRR